MAVEIRLPAFEGPLDLLLHLIADLMMGALDPRAKLEGMR